MSTIPKGENILDALQSEIERWTSMKEEYNKWFVSLALKWRIGETMYTQCKKLFDIMPDEFKRLHQLATDGREELEKELKEKEKECEELKKKVNDLTMDNMTHEYNQAEAEKTWPQFKQQIIDEWKTENNL